MDFKKVDLVYFNILAYAEPIKMLLMHGGIPFKFWMPWDYFGKDWNEAKREVPFGRLPVLIINEEHVLWESGSIMRFLAKHTNTLPKGDLLQAKAHAIFDSTKELVMPIDATINVRSGKRFIEEKASLLNALDELLEPFEQTLSENGPFLLGTKVAYCDFPLYHHLSILSLLTVEFLERYPLLKNFMQNFEKIRAVETYLNTRPTLSGIGIEPLLELNGVPTSTSFGRD
jgi:glutathione S-transferase